MLPSLSHWSIEAPAKALSLLQDLLALGMRLFVGWQFFKAGLLKIQSWDSTMYLFENEYRVPVLSPGVAAVMGTAGELVFPVLVWLGLAGRLSALGLQFVNIMAVVAYAHVIFDPQFGTGTAADHYLWGLMLLVIAVYGPGRVSVDHLLTRKA
jgi:putative oxidoreductase